MGGICCFAVAAAVVVVAPCVDLGVEAVPAWVVHKLAVAVAEASRVVCAVVVVVTAVVARCLALGAVVVAGNLRLI